MQFSVTFKIFSAQFVNTAIVTRLIHANFDRYSKRHAKRTHPNLLTFTDSLVFIFICSYVYMHRIPGVDSPSILCVEYIY